MATEGTHPNLRRQLNCTWNCKQHNQTPKESGYEYEILLGSRSGNSTGLQGPLGTRHPKFGRLLHKTSHGSTSHKGQTILLTLFQLTTSIGKCTFTTETKRVC